MTTSLLRVCLHARIHTISLGLIFLEKCDHFQERISSFTVHLYFYKFAFLFYFANLSVSNTATFFYVVQLVMDTFFSLAVCLRE